MMCIVTDPFLVATLEDWERMFATNATGVMLSYKYAAIQMIKQGRGGRIIGTINFGLDKVLY